MTDPNARILHWLTVLYGPALAAETWPRLAAQLDRFRQKRPQSTRPSSAEHLTQRDAILITYGDQISQPGSETPPLQTLAGFLDAELADCVRGVHILPCFPYSSDDGFSVIDYTQIDPALGDWDDVARLGRSYRLMFDFVANHISRHSAWFQAYRRGEAPYDRFFIEVDPATDLSQVVRPRALPLLTLVETAAGPRHVWTTFSDDQIDLNYANPAVLLAMTDVLLHYVAHGAEIIRLDAIAYLWKEIGTPCIHLPQTHAVVKLWRAVLDAVAPHVLLITETNVPHADNISYFGRPLPGTGSTDEAQLVYNFSLAPLTLHAFLTGDAGKLSAWAAELQTPAAGTSFFNFIASHDGIGVLPARGILSAAEIQALVDRTLAHGGHVSYRHNPDGSHSVYELNTTVYDFLNNPAAPDEEIDIRRFMASQVILLSLAGVPGIYIHSLFGSRNCHRCVAATGRARSINREKFAAPTIAAWLADPAARPRRVLDAYRHLLRQRAGQAAFHPASRQQVLSPARPVFALQRQPAGGPPLLCLVNVSDQPVTVDLRPDWPGQDSGWIDLIGGGRYCANSGRLGLVLAGYQAMWLAPLQS